MRSTVGQGRSAGVAERSATPFSGTGPLLAALTAIVALVAVGMAGCASSTATEADEWSAAYVDSPDRVWTAVQGALDELGYEVEEENRFEGTIRAAVVTDRPDQGVVLHIDQVQRTEVVRVHVRPSGGPATGPDGFRRLDEAARAFLAELDRRLGRRPPS